MKEKKNSLLRLCMAAMFAALICVATIVIQIPLPLGGFLNFGDCFILIAAWTLGPLYGCAAGAIGSAMADIITGYAVYAPATFVIKGLIGLTAAVVAHKLSAKGGRKLAAHILSAAVAEVIMVTGYFLYDALVMGYGFAGAAAGLPMNAVQGAAGVVFGCVIMQVIQRTKITEKL